MRGGRPSSEFERAARLRDRLTSVRKAIEKQQMVADRNEDLDVVGIAEDDLEAAVQVFFVRKGRVVGRKGFVLDKVEDLDARRAGRRRPRGPLRRRRRLGVPEAGAGADRARRPRALRGLAVASCAGSRSTIRVPQRGDKRALQETVDPQRQGGVHPPPAAPGQRPQQPGPGAQRAAGRPRPARGPAAHRVLRHEPHPGHRLRRLDGRDRGRPAEEVRLPAVQGAGGRRATTTSRPWRRCSPGASPPTWPSGRSRRPSGRASSPTRRSCCSSTAARASSAWPCGCSRSSASTRRSRWPSLAKRFEEVYVPGRGRPDPHPRGSPRRCTCCSASATRPTASPSPTTASCGASA